MIAQDKYHIERYVRQSKNSWLFSETKNLYETIHIASIECELALEEVYEKVEMLSLGDDVIDREFCHKGGR